MRVCEVCVHSHPEWSSHLVSHLMEQLERPHVVFGSRHQNHVFQRILQVVQQVPHLKTEAEV